MKAINYEQRYYESLARSAKYRLRILDQARRIDRLEREIQEHCREIERLTKGSIK